MGDDDSKPGGGSGTGIGCGCPSIKNYPSFTIEPGKQDEKGMPKPSPTGSRQFFFIDE
jgi:hypothetical protein